MTEIRAASSQATPSDLSLIDCDLHAPIPDVETLRPYLDARWHGAMRQLDAAGALARYYPPAGPLGIHDEHRPPGVDRDGAALDRLRRSALDEPGISIGILNCACGVDSIADPELAAAIARAVNDWLLAEWLEKEPRLRASLVVPSQQPELAAHEIDRLGSHPGFVQVFLPARSAVLYGNRLNHAMFEAAVRHDLVVSLQFGGSPGTPPTGTGWTSHFVEEYVGVAHVVESQIMNLISEGAFNRFPTLRLAIVEAGWAWVPAWMWRMDKEWKGLRREIPWVRDPPSHYFRRHMRFTLQPVDAPDPARFLQVVDQMGSEDLILYSSDYPHRHEADGTRDLISALPRELAAKIRVENALAFYRF